MSRFASEGVTGSSSKFIDFYQKVDCGSTMRFVCRRHGGHLCCVGFGLPALECSGQGGCGPCVGALAPLILTFSEALVGELFRAQVGVSSGYRACGKKRFQIRPSHPHDSTGFVSGQPAGTDP
jgi:hypothetical protein